MWDPEGQPGAGSIRPIVSSAAVMWSAHGQAVGRRSRKRHALVVSRAGTAMTVSCSVLVVTRPSRAAVAVHRARL